MFKCRLFIIVSVDSFGRQRVGWADWVSVSFIYRRVILILAPRIRFYKHTTTALLPAYLSVPFIWPTAMMILIMFEMK